MRLQKIKIYTMVLVLAYMLITLKLCKAIPKHILLNEETINDKKGFKIRLEKLQLASEMIFSKQIFMSLAMVNGKYIYDQQLSLFKEYVSLFQRTYGGNKTEYHARFEIFQESLQRQAAMNQRELMLNGTARYGINKFSDWKTEEFQMLLSEKFNRYNKTIPKENKMQASHYYPPLGPCAFYYKRPATKVDWTPWTTRIKNQRSCGSCWAFVAAEQVETYSAISGKKLNELSPQELVSCAPSLGCNGGNTCLALSWLVRTQFPLVPESVYPYLGRDSRCNYARLKSRGVKVKTVCGCQRLVGREYVMIQVLLQKGPLGVNVDAVTWQDYIGGVIQHHCSYTNLNHAVQLIGYNLEYNPVPHYIIRNQWGSSFGENGYVRVKYGSNICGVAEEPSFIAV